MCLSIQHKSIPASYLLSKLKISINIDFRSARQLSFALLSRRHSMRSVFSFSLLISALVC